MDFLIFCNCLRWYTIGDSDHLASKSVHLRQSIVYELFLNCKQVRNSMKLLKGVTNEIF